MMTEKKEGFITVYLYGRLRKLATMKGQQGESFIELPCKEGDRIKDIIAELQLKPEELSHIFLNGEYSGVNRKLTPGDRLGLFARDMHLLYRQYFPVKEGED